MFFSISPLNVRYNCQQNIDRKYQHYLENYFILPNMIRFFEKLKAAFMLLMQNHKDNRFNKKSAHQSIATDQIKAKIASFLAGLNTSCLHVYLFSLFYCGCF